MQTKLNRSALTLTLSLAAGGLAGCGDTGNWAVCANDWGRRVPDSDCRPGGGGGGAVGHWRYYNDVRNVPAVGENVGDALSEPASGSRYASAPEGGVARGGFGGTGEGRGGGGDGAGE